ncbi:hypothetical protein CLG96_01965 [Sphingomonas oleivorans]|uniref:Uncharacterized protein n=1 Tax=Sphingomonas oleivorans TaxID=1735121 RepID=A0A2T5G1D9_9SPHN|nr:hypothetical protein [Sphingomonas oleivorans]PTQ12931.1 hypothetical protein CLG96_01965 [Sphingomonas oleivorans]
MAVTETIAFEDEARALEALSAAGFSVGPVSLGLPRGIRFGSHQIPTWKHVRHTDRLAMDGEFHGVRVGPVKILVSPALSDEAAAAFDRVRAAAAQQVAA